MTIPLSEALQRGSVIIDPAAGDITRCAIAMALSANGIELNIDNIGKEPDPEDYGLDYETEANEWDNIPLRENEKDSYHELNVSLVTHTALLGEYPWLRGASGECPWCGQALRSTRLLHHPFDEHVMAGGVPLAALAAWLRSLEPPPPAPPPTLDIGLPLWLENEAEKRAVIEAAEAVGLTPASYVAAATRMVIEHGISVLGFARPRPEILPYQDVRYTPYLKKGTPSGDPELVSA